MLWEVLLPPPNSFSSPFAVPSCLTPVMQHRPGGLDAMFTYTWYQRELAPLRRSMHCIYIHRRAFPGRQRRKLFPLFPIARCRIIYLTYPLTKPPALGSASFQIALASSSCRKETWCTPSRDMVRSFKGHSVILQAATIYILAGYQHDTFIGIAVVPLVHTCNLIAFAKHYATTSQRSASRLDSRRCRILNAYQDYYLHAHRQQCRIIPVQDMRHQRQTCAPTAA